MELNKIAGTVAMSLDLALYAWPVSVLVVVATVWGIAALRRKNRLRSWQTLTVAGLLLFPLFVVPAYTVEFWADPAAYRPDRHEEPLDLLIAGWAVFALVLATCICKAQGFRLPLAGAASLLVWFSAGVYMVSVMAVSGVWL
jgi:hypothetical protein